MIYCSKDCNAILEHNSVSKTLTHNKLEVKYNNNKNEKKKKPLYTSGTVK